MPTLYWESGEHRYFSRQSSSRSVVPAERSDKSSGAATSLLLPASPGRKRRVYLRETAPPTY